MPAIRDAVNLINRMEADGVIERYAIGGAVGASFYLEPLSTVDVDVFVAFEPAPGSLIATPQHIYDYLTARGGKIEREYVVISGWPVQFLPPMTPLVAEALQKAVTRNVDGISVRVLTAEHLAAIALQTERAKDKARLLQFVEAGALDMLRFKAILARHSLASVWQKFERQFLSNTL